MFKLLFSGKEKSAKLGLKNLKKLCAPSVHEVRTLFIFTHQMHLQLLQELDEIYEAIAEDGKEVEQQLFIDTIKGLLEGNPP